LWHLSKRPHPKGALFRIFLAHLTWYFAIDFLKPQPLVHGLNFIQWACLAGLAALAIGALTPQMKQEAIHA
jgi:phosphatidylglycerol:prolipoprotein diacylglycerol transferase